LRVAGRSAPDQRLDDVVEQTVQTAAYGVALAALRTGLILAALAAATDWLFALAGGRATAATVVEGFLLTALALAALARGELAAQVLRPRGRVAILAGLFAAAGAVDFGLQSHFGEVASAIMFNAALVSSARWVAISLAVSVLGYLGDLAIRGDTPRWMLLGGGHSMVLNQVVDLVLNAAAGMVLIALLRRFMVRVPATLAAARAEGEAVTPLLARAVGAPASAAALLPRADPGALIAALTAAERDVLALLAQGRAPKQAARDQGVALSTVRSHIAAAKRKTGARTLEQLVALFAEAHVVR
jgi:DNA-binding CsgD family transcriptional regulator